MSAIDLKRYLSECELNYLRLVRLAPIDFNLTLSAGYQLVFALENAHQRYAQFTLEVVEQSVYTTMLSLQYIFDGVAELPESLQSFSELRFDVRLYHDAKALEIMGFQGHYRIQPSYPYPNKKMLQKDEKLQQQLLMSVCLQNALKDALSIDVPWQPK